VSFGTLPTYENTVPTKTLIGGKCRIILVLVSILVIAIAAYDNIIAI
jgi:hypothetical protein